MPRFVELSFCTLNLEAIVWVHRNHPSGAWAVTLQYGSALLIEGEDIETLKKAMGVAMTRDVRRETAIEAARFLRGKAFRFKKDEYWRELCRYFGIDEKEVDHARISQS